MTERLYYSDAYQRTFDARIVERADGGRTLYLDRTAFYPTSGGQPFDTGTIAGIAVTDVVDEGDRIAHHLAAPAPAGDAVAGAIDWARRYDHMQQHTGQHLLSAIFADRFGLDTVSVHFGAHSATLDVSAERVPREKLVTAEELANAAIAENRAVSVSFEDASTATGLRKATAREGMLRVITIDALDRSACGGTHVRAIGEIGAILIRRTERVRHATRVEFVCGMRAVRAARADHELVAELAQTAGVAPAELVAAAKAQREELRAAQAGRREAASALDGYRARERYDAAAPDANGRRRIVERRATGTVDELRSLAQAAVALGSVLFIGALDAPPTIVLASSDGGIDAGTALRKVLADAGGRGGGNARIAQGTVPSVSALEAVIEAL
jgi:alanyl-tRNA synthetase